MSAPNLSESLANLPTLPGAHPSVDNIHEARQETLYRIQPLIDITDKQTIVAWLHCQVSKTYYLIHYHSECKGWVTDSKNGGNPIRVAKLTAKLWHFIKNPGPGVHFDYPQATGEAHNSDKVEATFNFWGIGIANEDASGMVCVEDPKFGTWCVSAST